MTVPHSITPHILPSFLLLSVRRQANAHVADFHRILGAAMIIGSPGS